MRDCDKQTNKEGNEREKQTMSFHPMTSSTSLRVGRRLGLAGALCALLTGSLASAQGI